MALFVLISVPSQQLASSRQKECFLQHQQNACCYTLSDQNEQLRAYFISARPPSPNTSPWFLHSLRISFRCLCDGGQSLPAPHSLSCRPMASARPLCIHFPGEPGWMLCPRVSGRLLCAPSLGPADASSLSLDWKWILCFSSILLCAPTFYLLTLVVRGFSSPTQ